MDGCEIYQIKPLTRFEISYKQLIKNHYRKDKRARDAFEELLDSYISQLQETPSSDDISENEGFPKGEYSEDFEFRKIRFNPPGLRGQAKYGRLMYVVYKPKCLVYLVWIYTHAEFGGKNKTRPPSDDLKQEFRLIKQDIEEMNQKEEVKQDTESESEEKQE